MLRRRNIMSRQSLSWLYSRTRALEYVVGQFTWIRREMQRSVDAGGVEVLDLDVKAVHHLI